MHLVPVSRRRRRLLAAAVVVLALFCAATARLFVWPPTDAPTRANAVVALGGDPEERPAYRAIALVEAGYAPVAVVSLGGVPPAPCPHAPRIRVVCFRANPLDTRGEAEYVARLAARHHWQHLIIVPERSQTTRARHLVRAVYDRGTALGAGR